MAVSIESIHNLFSNPLKHEIQEQNESPYMVEVYVASKDKTHFMDNVRYREVSARMERIIKSSSARRNIETAPQVVIPEKRVHKNRLMAAAVTLFTAIK